MARIRSIKPEFWTSEQVAECSIPARLLFIGLWSFCDDRGVHPASCRRLKMQVFPSDSVEVGAVEAWVNELITADLLDTFESEGREFWYVTGWRHQKIDKPTYKHPVPPRWKLDDDSTNARGGLDEPSPPDGMGSGGDVDVDADETSPNGEVGGAICSEANTPTEDRSEFAFPTTGKGPAEWWLSKAKLAEYVEAYPALDVATEMRLARQWCRDNLRNRKTASGMIRFLTDWLNRSQNRGSRSGPAGQPQRPRGKPVDLKGRGT